MKKYNLVFVSPEMMIPEFGEPACGANFRGGLGILAGDIMDGLFKKGVNAIAVVPFYKKHWLTKENINYDLTSAGQVFSLKLFNGKELGVRTIKRAGIDVYGIMNDDFDELYTSCRYRRLIQEVLLGHAVPAILKKLGLCPDIVWLQEGHCSVVIPVMKEMPEFSTCKYLFTTHTPVPEGLEKFDSYHFHEMKIHDKYQPVFLHYDKIDMTQAAMILSDHVNAVSEEHEIKTKEMFPKFAHKISGVTNGSSIELWQSPNVKKLDGSLDGLLLWEAHQQDKKAFIEIIKEETGVQMDFQKPILSWVRRFAPYKNQFPILEPIMPALCAEKGEIVEIPGVGRLEGLGYQLFGAGLAHELDYTCQGWMRELEKWNEIYKERFVFLPKYSLKLRQIACQGSDVWFSSPMLKHEACGTSDQCAMQNGVVNLTTCGGGAAESVKEFNLITCEGNGCFIEPYTSIGLYFKAKFLSDLYYDWINNSNSRWLRLKANALKAGRDLDVIPMILKYEQIFAKILSI